MCATVFGVKMWRPKKPRVTTAPCRRASAYTAAPEPTFATQVSAKMTHAFMTPRPDRNAPSATATSAGTGGKMFSMAASVVISAYSGPVGRCSRYATKSVR